MFRKLRNIVSHHQISAKNMFYVRNIEIIAVKRLIAYKINVYYCVYIIFMLSTHTYIM